MDATITINELFSFVLYLLGIGLLFYMIILVRNINGIVVKARQIVDGREKEIDAALKEVPDIMSNTNNIVSNVSHITDDTKELVEKVSPDITDILSNASSISKKVDTIGEKALESMELITESIFELAYAIEDNIRSISDYVYLILEIIDVVKNILKKK